VSIARCDKDELEMIHPFEYVYMLFMCLELSTFILILIFFFRTNPFAHVKLRRTVTNDRSAPIIE
jgi:hypothetical protein